MEHREHRRDREPTSSDWMAIDRLFDQHELGDSEADRLAREARQTCGRWLMLCRQAAHRTRAEVAARIGVDEQLLTLLELGLADNPLVSAEAWYRLALVLEGPGYDYERVGAVIQCALGAEPAPEPWLDELAAELIAKNDLAVASLDVDHAPAAQLLRDADRVMQEHSEWQLPRNNFLILHALRQAGERSLNAFEIKLAVEKLARLSLNLADLPALLLQLHSWHLVARTDGSPPVYRISAEGKRVAVAALQHATTQQLLTTRQTAQETLEGLLRGRRPGREPSAG